MKLHDLKWTQEPFHRRTPEEHSLRTAILDAYMKTTAVQTEVVGEVDKSTALPLPPNKHQFTPVERISLDYRGNF